MATLGYNCQTVCRAFEELALHEGDLRVRVFLAACPELLQLEADVFPSSIGKHVKCIQGMLTRYPPKDASDMLHTNFMRSKTSSAKKIARRVWTIYNMLDTAMT